MPDDEEPGPWTVPGGRVLDYPRFEYRSAMLDVARHFFSVEQVKCYINLISLYKIYHLHLHPTDDQGWRIEIDSWPKLTEIGGSTEVGGGPGGILHGRRLPGDHRLRTGTLHHGRPRDRRARPHQCGDRLLRGTPMRRRTDRFLHWC
ncbi:hypothetical protein BRD01_04050 [Halobacteriales archaeon QS_8_65_32]|nr:MAG: hypothetical protein BRD01_04050 [Halobacteriales archaeon QS_8_65_32]